MLGQLLPVGLHHNFLRSLLVDLLALAELALRNMKFGPRKSYLTLEGFLNNQSPMRKLVRFGNNTRTGFACLVV